jgi:hypothetical protein
MTSAEEIAEEMQMPEYEIHAVLRLIDLGYSDQEICERFNAIFRPDPPSDKPLH